MLFSMPNPRPQGQGGLGRQSSGSSPNENASHGAGVPNRKETLS